MTFTLQLSGHNWADATLRHQGQEYAMCVFHLSDAITDMAVAAVLLHKGSTRVWFAFEDESEEHFFVLERGPDDHLKLTLFANSQCFSRRAEREIMSVDCTVLDFAGQVLSSLHSLLVQEGALYKERWGFDFPMEAYEYLRSSL